MAAEDNLSNQFKKKIKWIPVQRQGWKIKDHILTHHFRQSDVPSPSKYDDKAWRVIHDDLHSKKKMSEPHQHWTPKDYL